MNPHSAPRVVSKSRYLRFVIEKAALCGSGVFLFGVGVLGATTCTFLLLSGIWWSWVTHWYDYSRNPVLTPMLSVLVCVLIAVLFVLIACSGPRQVDRAARLEPLVPFTRQVAEHLPAEQSLVRASSEPSALQQAVLLRAAGSDSHTPSQELLRAATQEEPSTG
jgi:hypothetical protein